MNHTLGCSTSCLLLILVAAASGFECERALIGGSISLTREVLDDVLGDVQRVVDCVGHHGSIVVEAGLMVKLPSTVQFTKGLVFKSTAEGDSRPVLECPRDLPLFKIRSAGVVLQNLIISNCELAGSELSALVVDIDAVESEKESNDPDVVIENVNFLHNRNENGPGAVYVRAVESVALVRVIFMNNSGRDGGAIALQSGGSAISFERCAFVENTASGNGGAVFQNSSLDLTISHSEFLLNRAHALGGAISLQGSHLLTTVNVSSSIFEGNSVKSNDAQNTRSPEQALLGGGAIALQGPRLNFRIASTNFTKNSAGGVGGGILFRELTKLGFILGYIESVGFVNNIAEAGGALSIQAPFVNTTVELNNGQFIGNVAVDSNEGVYSGSGGAISIAGPESELITTSMIFVNNTAEGLSESGMSRPMGGAIYVENAFRIVMRDCLLRGNNALQKSPTMRLASGGALHLQAPKRQSFATISNCTFVENLSDEGGAVSLDGVWLVDLVNKVSFRENRANSQGGAIAMQEMGTLKGQNIVFSMNQAGSNGGAVAIKGRNNHIELSSSVFQGNKAIQGSGGALILVNDGNVVQLATKISLVGNRAWGAGGAIAIFCSNCLTELNQANISDNSSQESGGAIAAKSVGELVGLVLTDVVLSKNFVGSKQKEILGSGGALMIEGLGVNLSTHGFIHFYKNKARHGAAIRLVDSGVATIDNAIFESNSGLRGGGIYATFTGELEDNTLKVTNTTFNANTAIIGGGLMVDNKNHLESHYEGAALDLPISERSPSLPQVKLTRIHMQYQIAEEEGSGLYMNGIKGACDNCTFNANSVRNLDSGLGGAISLQGGANLYASNIVLSRNSAATGGSVSVTDSTLVGERLNFVENVATKFGGGVALMGTGGVYSKVGHPHLDLKDSRLEGNVAKIGAGVNVNVKETQAPSDCEPLVQGMMAVPRTEPSSGLGLNWTANSLCSELRHGEPVMVKLMNVRMELNTAKEAGGGIYFDQPSAVCACCGNSCTNGCAEAGQVANRSLLGVCSTYWTGNKVSSGYGPDVGSAVVKVDVVSGDGNGPEQTPFLAGTHNSGDMLQEFTLRFLDASGQVVTNSPPNAFVRLSAKRGILSGQVDKAVVSGMALFTSAIFSGIPGEYTVSAALPAALNMPDEVLRINIRECAAGEHAQGAGSSGFRCVKCSDGMYSLDPNSACVTCPDNAICDGKSITPADGYWSSSCQPNKVRKCLARAACSHENGRPSMHWNNTSSASNGMCSKGYEGVLCGNCSKGYGRYRRFKCRECSLGSRSIVLVVLLGVWSLVVLLFLIRNALKPQKFSRPPPAVAERRLEGEFEIIPCPHQSNSRIEIVGLNQSAEAAKIFINFVQVTSMALLLQIQWPESIKQMLRIEDRISGIAAEGSIFYYDCFLQQWISSLFLRRFLLSCALPAGVFILVLAFWLARAFLKPRGWPSLLRQLSVSTSVFTFFFYSGALERVFGLAHGLRIGSLLPDQSSSTLYWVDGIISRYFAGDHLMVATTVGIPSSIVLIGFPVAIFWILRCRKPQTHNAELAARFGFLYQAYREKCTHWELAIIGRKVLLAAIVVFGGPWNSYLQCIGGLMVMIVALVAHLVAQPFRNDVSGLNHLEALSLFGTVTTFTVGLVFNGEEVASWVRLLVSICLLILTAIVLVWVTKTILFEGLDHVDEWLEKDEIASKNDPWTKKIKALKEWLWRKSMNLFWSQIERLNGDRIGYVERQKTIAYREAMELERIRQLGVSMA